MNKTTQYNESVSESNGDVLCINTKDGSSSITRTKFLPNFLHKNPGYMPIVRVSSSDKIFGPIHLLLAPCLCQKYLESAQMLSSKCIHAADVCTALAWRVLVCFCGKNWIGHVTWWPLMELLSWYPLIMTSHRNSFENRLPVWVHVWRSGTRVYGCTFEDRVPVWVHDLQMNCSKLIKR